jgi:hypothetical protein
MGMVSKIQVQSELKKGVDIRTRVVKLIDQKIGQPEVHGFAGSNVSV